MLASINFLSLSLAGVFLFFTSLSSCLEYEKNKNILKSEKYTNKSTFYELSSLSLILDRIKNNEKVFLLFYLASCDHCKKAMPEFEEATKYLITKGFEFIKVKCPSSRETCLHFDVHDYPNFKMFLKGKKVNIDPERETEAILELIDKVSSPNIFHLNSTNNISDFAENYGENSFILYDNSTSSRFYNCVNHIAEEKYKTELNFGYVDTTFVDVERPKQLKLVGKHIQFNNHLHLRSNTTCDDLVDFIEANKFSLLKHLSWNYIKKLFYSNKKALITAVNLSEPSHKKFLDQVIFEEAIKWRKEFVFTFVDIEKDKKLLKFFNLGEIINPRIVAFDFKTQRYHIDKIHYDGNDEELKTMINIVLKAFYQDKLTMTKGSFFQDFLFSLGLEMTPEVMIIMMAIVIFGIVIVCAILARIQGEKITVIEQKPRNQNQSVKPTTDTAEMAPLKAHDKKN